VAAQLQFPVSSPLVLAEPRRHRSAPGSSFNAAQPTSQLVVPYREKNYYACAHRHPQKQSIDLDGLFGLHPSLSPFNYSSISEPRLIHAADRHMSLPLRCADFMESGLRLEEYRRRLAQSRLQSETCSISGTHLFVRLMVHRCRARSPAKFLQSLVQREQLRVGGAGPVLPRRKPPSSNVRRKWRSSSFHGQARKLSRPSRCARCHPAQYKPAPDRISNNEFGNNMKQMRNCSSEPRRGSRVYRCRRWTRIRIKAASMGNSPIACASFPRNFFAFWKHGDRAKTSSGHDVGIRSHRTPKWHRATDHGHANVMSSSVAHVNGAKSTPLPASP